MEGWGASVPKLRPTTTRVRTGDGKTYEEMRAPDGTVTLKPLLDEEVGSRDDLPVIVLYGSSVALGSYAVLNQGWAYDLKNALHGVWKVFNESQSGSTADVAIARFDGAVGRHKPYVVVISLSLANEGFYPGVVEVFTRNMRKLVEKCKGIGAIPVVCSPYPNGIAAEYPQVKDMLLKTREELAKWEDCRHIDFWEGMSTELGTWRDDEFVDGSHPNSKGHAAMFKCIPLGLFLEDLLPKETK